MIQDKRQFKNQNIDKICNYFYLEKKCMPTCEDVFIKISIRKWNSRKTEKYICEHNNKEKF